MINLSLYEEAKQLRLTSPRDMDLSRMQRNRLPRLPILLQNASFGGWGCWSPGVVGFGDSKEEAYARWADQPSPENFGKGKVIWMGARP